MKLKLRWRTFAVLAWASSCAWAQVSKPVVPAQPDKLQYGVLDLSLFKTYTRDSYLAAFGVQAPAYDPSRRIKAWFDSTVDASDPEEAVVYKILSTDKNGAPSIKQIALTSKEASTVNLPGVVTYPSYVIAPTQASRGPALLSPGFLSLESQGREIIAAVGRGDLVDEGTTDQYPVIYPAGEPRRMWAILIGGTQTNAGALLQDRNARGVGSPGHWTLPPNGGVAWIADPPAPTGFDDTRPWREMPLRDLLPNEVVTATPFGVVIVRTDKQQQADQADGKFTPSDRQMLQQILEILTKK